jgi:ribulose-phosphate 3-epimerase
MITPIIMESDMDEVVRKFLQLQEIPRVHFDIGDGLFSNLLSVSPADLQQLDLSGKKTDIHLLVDDPTEWIEESVALQPIRLIAQIEHMGSQTAFLQAVAAYGGVVGGLGLKIETPLEELEEQALAQCGVVLLLAIPPGTTGSPFDERVIPKIKELRNIYSGAILIDGGMTPTTYAQVMAAGATEAGANSAWWRGDFA